MAKVIDIPEEYIPDIDDLPGDIAFIARGIEKSLPGEGVRIALIMAQVFPGLHFYIRSVKELLFSVRDDAIRKEYDDGTKVKELAFKWHLSTRWVEQILSRANEKVDGKQLNLF